MIRTLLAVAFLWAAAGPAMAYIDPGTGLLLLQGVIAVVGGIIVFVKHPIQTCKRWFAKLRGRKDA